jgi:predicted DNA-binding protein (UPF0278 family)
MKTKQLPFYLVERDPSLEELREDVERTLRRNRALIGRGAGETEHLERMAELSKQIVDQAVRHLREALRRCR